MKNTPPLPLVRILFLAGLFYVTAGCIQAQQLRYVEWQKSYYPDRWYEHPHNELDPGTPTAYRSYTGHEQTGEDWMYKIQNWYDSLGNKDGYLMCGYVTFQNKPYRFADCDSNGTPETEINPPGRPDFMELECSDTSNYHWKGSEHAAAMRVDSNGNVVWFKAYGEEYGEMWSCIQSSSNRNHIYLAGRGGTASGVVYQYWDSVQNKSDSALLPNPYRCTNIKKGFMAGRKAYLIKLDKEGNLLWEYTYGEQDPNEIDPDSAYQLEGMFWDLAEADSGHVIAVGCVTEWLNSTNISPQRGFIAKISPSGRLIKKLYFPVSVSDTNGFGFYGIEKENDHSFVLVYNRKDEGKVGVFRIDENLNESLLSPFDGVLFEPFQGTPGVDNIANGSIVNFEGNNSFFAYDIARKPTLGGAYEFVLGIASLATTHHIFEFPGIDDTSNNEGIIVLLHNDLSYKSQHSLGEVSAYDLKVGVCVLGDTTICGISSTHRRLLNTTGYLPEDYDVSTCCSAGGIIPAEGAAPNKGTQFYRSDGIVANFSSDLSEMNWSTLIVDPMDEGTCWPDNVKKQLCMYSIAEGPNGDLMACGNNGINFDDVHVVKLSDCLNQADPGFTYDWAPTYPGILNNASQYFKGINEDISTLDLFLGTSVTVGTPRTISGRLIVEGGFHLVVQSSNAHWRFQPLQDPYEPQVIVRDGATLTLDGACKLSSLYADSAFSTCMDIGWGGIYVEDGGTLIVQNSTIESAYTGVTCEDGGVVQIINDVAYDTLPNFVNCFRRVEILGQTNAAPSLNNEFRRAYFLNNKPLFFSNHGGDDGGQNRYTKGLDFMVKVRDHSGTNLRFTSCRFENLEEDAPFVHGTGVLGLYSALDFVKGGTQTTTYLPELGDPCQVPDEKPNTFIGLNEGISLGNAGANTLRLRALECDFIDCNNAFSVAAAVNSTLYGNNIVWTDSFSRYTNMPSWNKYGIFTAWCSSTKLWENRIDNYDEDKAFTAIWTGRSTNAALTGAGADHRGNIVEQHGSEPYGFGDWMLHDNSQMQLTCNEYTNLNTDWTVEEIDPDNGNTLADQGDSANYHNNNRWSNPGSGFYAIHDFAQVPDWKYYIDSVLDGNPEYPDTVKLAAILTSGSSTPIDCSEKNKCVLYAEDVSSEEDDFIILAMQVPGSVGTISSLSTILGGRKSGHLAASTKYPKRYYRTNARYRSIVQNSAGHNLEAAQARHLLWFDYATGSKPKHEPLKRLNKNLATSSRDISEESKWVLYPNPTKETVSILSSLEKIERADLYNLQGQRVATWEFKEPEHNVELPVRNMPLGLYILRIGTDQRLHKSFKLQIR
ncbi:MAG: T9SS type A sorting domain-containing protein [Flavobacteriales bacterium]|nr:T9SS type A sorting domain-containing protein [Flavobacteriales bacterium]